MTEYSKTEFDEFERLTKKLFDPAENHLLRLTEATEDIVRQANDRNSTLTFGRKWLEYLIPLIISLGFVVWGLLVVFDFSSFISNLGRVS